MALSVEATKAELIKELEARGFVTEGEHSKNDLFMEAIAAAMMTIMTRDAQVVVDIGSSSGTYKVT
ncbi:hypothetical protein [Vibrio fluvialis]|uniref:hypothetical protein n=1 Tax=Vibrio fluvialis TaxID=676 RepID=UPI001C9D2F0B|nr:hypothetical protein [Vibrio fluvialis]MBY7970864.1 hypothetical protein [Vibrio fluvialis]MBY8196091.1 hypothetical protein [Vibrio fluvialis]MDT8866358.1 hypothetical protein [Vibrio fluvialis]MDT8874126.1 hypothetical protein [Vibrio fluvialis]